MEFVGKKKYLRAVVNENVEVFVVYIASLLTIHLAKKAQIAFLFIKKLKILEKYSNYAGV